MATSSRFREISDIAECPICAEEYRTPKPLPCAHTFCLPCLDEYCQSFSDDKSLVCPLCRNPFTVPEGGCRNLPENLLFDDFESSLAEVWTDSPETTFEDDSWTSRTCDQHPHEDLAFYCLECKLPGFVKCLSKVHSKHEWKPIMDFLEDFQSRIKVDVVKIHDTHISNIHDQLREIEIFEQTFYEKIKEKENWILKKGEEIRMVVDKHVQMFLQNLSHEKTIKEKEKNAHKNELEARKTELTTFNSYVELLLRPANSFHLARVAKELTTRVEDLTSKPKNYDMNTKRWFVDFSPNDSMKEMMTNKISGLFPLTPLLVNIFSLHSI